LFTSLNVFVNFEFCCYSVSQRGQLECSLNSCFDCVCPAVDYKLTTENSCFCCSLQRQQQRSAA